jgi:hypothetical protein
LNTRVSIPTNPAADEERNDKRALCTSTALNLTKLKTGTELLVTDEKKLEKVIAIS